MNKNVSWYVQKGESVLDGIYDGYKMYSEQKHNCENSTGCV